MNGRTSQSARLDDGAAYAAPARPRPLLLPTLAFIAGVVLSEYVGGTPDALRRAVFLIPFLTFGVALILALRQPSRTALVNGLIVAVALGFGFSRHQAAIWLPPNHVAHLVADEPILTCIAGQVVTEPTTAPAEKRNPFLPFDPPPRTRFVLDAAELRTIDPPAPIRGFVRVTVEAEALSARLGDHVIVTGRFYRPHGPRNPGEIDWARWSRLQNIYAGLATDGPEYVQRYGVERAGLLSWIADLRARAQSLLFSPYADVESDRPLRLLDTMVLGHRSAAGRVLNEAFLRTGSIHFLTVSGFHVGVLAGAVWLFVRRLLRRGLRAAALLTMGAIVLYAALAEPNAPILRAATMGILLCLAQLTRRPFCGLNWLAFSALFILACNPLELFRAGFQLSFVQVLALFTVVPYIYRRIVRRRTTDDVPADADTYRHLVARWIWRWFAGLALVCICAWIVALPLVLCHFGRLAPLGAFQAIIVSPLVVLTVVAAFVVLLLGWVPILGELLGFVLRGITGSLLWAVDRLSQLPHTLIEMQRPPAPFALFVYAGALLLVWTWRPRPRVLQTPTGNRQQGQRRIGGTLGAVALACVGIGWSVAPRLNEPDGVTIHVLSVGSGAATLLTTPDRAALFDAGTMYNFDAGETVVQAARALGVRELDLLTLSHANFDHYSGAATVLKGLPTGRLLFNPYFEASAAENPAVRQFLDLLPSELPPRSRLRAGDRFMLGEAAIEVLWPPGDLGESWRPNDRSLVLRIEGHGRSVLILGDIERAALRSLLDSHSRGRIDLKADVLIAPHHGSVVPVDTAAFFEAVGPEVVIVSTGRERPKLVGLVREVLGDAAHLISTDETGATRVCITREGELRAETPFAPAHE